MNLQTFAVKNLFYAVIDSMYDENEIKQLQKEFAFLETIKQNPNFTNSAIKNNKSLKTGGGVFVDDVYRNRESSTILNLNRRLFNPSLIEKLNQNNCFYAHLNRCTIDTTLVNFYKHGDSYKSHTDGSVLTALTFFKLGNFSGGKFYFSEYDISIEPTEGRTVIFPGCVLHHCDPIEADDGNYRITMAQFIGYEV